MKRKVTETKNLLTEKYPGPYKSTHIYSKT